MANTRKNRDVAGTDQPAGTAPTEAAPTVSPDEKRRPIQSFREDDVSASVWARQHMVRGQLLTFYSVTLERSYRDNTGQYRYTKIFDGDCLGRLAAVIQKAAEYIHGLISKPAQAVKS
jgi:hypothetical protein